MSAVDARLVLRRAGLAVALAAGAAGCFQDPGPPLGTADGGGPGLDAGAGHWQFIESNSLIGTGTIPLTQPTSPGDLLVVAAHQADMELTFVDSASRTFMPIASSTAICTSGAGLGFYFDLPAAGVTAVTTPHGESEWTVWHFSGIGSASPVGQITNVGVASTTAVSPTITTTIPGELVVAAAISEKGILGLSSGSSFVEDHNTNDNGNGYAHLDGTSHPVGTMLAASWEQTGSYLYCASIVVFPP